MSDPAANPSPGNPGTPESAPQTPPSATPPTPETPAATPEPSSTLIGGADAPATEEPGAETAPKVEEAATPFDVAALKFPEELGKPDEGMLNEFADIAKSAGLSQEAAQRIADLHIKAVQGISEGNRKVQVQMIADWEAEIKSDPTIGGDKLGPALAQISRVIEDPRFKVEGVREAFDLTGAGSNPAITRFLAKIAAVLSEGSVVEGNAPGAQAPRTAAQIMYPNHPSEAR